MRRFLIVLLSLAQLVFPEEQTYNVEDQTHIPILTPSLQERQTTKLRLANGLEAYLISDPSTKDSGAALMVEAGSWLNPQETPGLAHFTEHMLFLGNKKYPEEMGFFKYIRQHGGTANAYTADLNTTYFFSINNNSFDEAFDRFGNFFIAPLFNRSGMERERHAVDQEHHRNLENDTWRLLAVLEELGAPDHPFSRFGTGNIETLSSLTAEDLQLWYRDHYSANLMHLVVYSYLPLEELQKTVVEMFSKVPDYQLPRWEQASPMIDPQNQNHYIFIEPIRDTKQLLLVWEIPPTIAELQDSKPDLVVKEALGHAGSNSLRQHLKDLNLIDDLTTFSYRLSSHNKLFFIEIDLTKEGLSDYQKVIEKCFQAIADLRQQGVPSYLFKEQKQIDLLNYQYQSRPQVASHVASLADNTIYEDLTTFPERTSILQSFNPQANQELLDYLSPRNCYFMVVADPAIIKKTLSNTEQWYGVKYSTEPVPSETLHRWSQAAPLADISIPPPNNFIPENLELQNAYENQQAWPTPELIIDNSHAQIYFSTDKYYLVPESFLKIYLKTPALQAYNPRSFVLGNLYIKIINDILLPQLDQALQAGLNYEINIRQNGIEIEVYGYSATASTLLKAICAELQHLKITPQQFENYKAAMLENLRNFYKETPIQQGLEKLRQLTIQDYTSAAQKAKVLENLKLEDLNNFIEHLFDQAYTEGLFYGNITAEEGQQLWEEIYNSLKYLPYPIEYHYHPKVVELPTDSGPYSLTFDIPEHGNAAILLFDQGNLDFPKLAAQDILAKSIDDPFFYALRTQQQTGYLVKSQALELENHLYMLFFSLSATHRPKELLMRYEQFLEGFLQELGKPDGIDNKSFESIRQARIKTLEDLPQNYLEMGDDLYHIITEYEADFGRRTKHIEALKALTFEEFTAFAHRQLDRNNHQRAALLIRGVMEGDSFEYTPLKNLQDLQDLSHYQSEKSQGEPPEESYRKAE
ncbi:MAG: insulinase family protein [Chlamydiota bacterium]